MSYGCETRNSTIKVKEQIERRNNKIWSSSNKITTFDAAIAEEDMIDELL